MKWSTLSYGFALEEDPMPRKIYKPEEIVAKLRQVDVLTPQELSRLTEVERMTAFDASRPISLCSWNGSSCR